MTTEAMEHPALRSEKHETSNSKRGSSIDKSAAASAVNKTTSSFDKPSPSERPSRPYQRQPAPSLFVGPPTRNASAPDLHLSTTVDAPNARTNLLHLRHDRPAQLPTVDATSPDRARAGAKQLNPVFADPLRRAGDGAGVGLGLRGEDKQRAREQERERAEAIWAEMQNTLEEVELSVASGGSVFSRDHARALEELRRAQIALAQAWTRSEADDGAADEEDAASRGGTDGPQAVGETSLLRSHKVSASSDGGEQRRGSGDRSLRGEAGRATAGGTGGRKGSTDGGAKTQLEIETENDIQLARQRRQTNDRYFERVNRGVVDVVAKLQDVAEKMKAVEMESKEVWADKDSVEDGDET